MKKIFLTAAVLTAAASVSVYPEKLTIKNTIGSDLDTLGEYDLYSHTKQKVYSASGDTISENDSLAFGDELQAEFESDSIEIKGRLEFLWTDNEEAYSDLIFIPSGYVYFKPSQYFSIAAGNNFYKRFSIPSAYLAAADDTTKYGRLLTDSLGHEEYFGTDSFSVFSNGFALGATSEWNWGDYNQFNLILAAGSTMYPGKNEFESAYDFGTDFNVTEFMDFGFTIHNFTAEDYKMGFFAGLTSIDNLILNAAFYYNFTTSDYLPETCVIGNDDEDNDIYKFKKQSTKYAVGLSGGYNFENLGFSIYADVISGLNDEYIGTIKYYDSNGNLIDTKTATISRGSTIVKYKNGKAKRNDKFTSGAIPFYHQLRLSKTISENLELELNFKLRTMFGNTDSTWTTLYPKVTVELPSDAGSISTGIRFDWNNAQYDGLSSVSIPLTWSYKFKKKF
ncbi:hypothetical protein HNP77_001082 [Treponema rectale]|uniref:Uncharacterized protein n=1 Tax=Treponema rectale TaxID=744512 RepID=A0A840SGQ3_9SPIR|nr:hypothetical protein [Treponema rectale]MBB5218713.1 hypothetical protein [Treponema rectale]